jgi:LiaI-LiaF-like transmembrane region
MVSMSDRIRCGCQCCTINSLMGPVIITTLGILFLLSELHGDYLSFSNTWPVILVVAGLVKLASALAPRTGHVNGATVPTAQPGAPQAPPSAPSQGQGQ